jgi:bifunctional oligoribonuclease and PAP phosphatase NrnA
MNENKLQAKITTGKNKELFEQTADFLAQHSKFLLATHARTDGDDLGSMLALTQALLNQGKKVVPVAWGGVPESLKFLPKQNLVLEDSPEEIIPPNFDAVILFGCNRRERTSLDSIIRSPLPLLNIDHHPDNQNFGQINLVDKSKSSVAELVYDLLCHMNITLNSDIAKCLLTGIFTDTGSFMHANTQPSTLVAAADLMKYGARIDKIHGFTYKSKNPETMHAWARAIENTRVDQKNQVAISVVTEEDIEEIGPLNRDTFNGFVETLNSIPETRYAIFLRQDGEFVKGSIRSEERKEVDVSAIAKSLGGGGHKLAAGFELKGRIKKQPDGGWKVEESK